MSNSKKGNGVQIGEFISTRLNYFLIATSFLILSFVTVSRFPVSEGFVQLIAATGSFISLWFTFMQYFTAIRLENQEVIKKTNGKNDNNDDTEIDKNKLAENLYDFTSFFHDLRHTHVTIMLKSGIHPKIVSERLGHATVAFTLDTYSHVVPGLQEAAASAFDKMIQVK